MMDHKACQSWDRFSFLSCGRGSEPKGGAMILKACGGERGARQLGRRPAIRVVCLLAAFWVRAGGAWRTRGVEGAVLALPGFVELAEALQPSVVNITATYQIHEPPPGDPFEFFERFFQEGGRALPPRILEGQSRGSGFIISSDGEIITNHHVIEGASQVGVRLADGSFVDAEVVGTDPRTDLALLRIRPDQALTPAALGDSDVLKVGEWVIAIGNPFGLGHTVTAGIVSAKGRVIGAGPYDDFIQTDASINPGNSGGPLFNAEGEVVGINTIKGLGEGIGFAIPINLARNVVEQLRTHGRVVRAFLGVQIESLTPGLATSLGLEEGSQGALIREVIRNSPADQAGLRRGDVILSMNQDPLEDPRVFPRWVADRDVGETVTLEIVRGDGQGDVQRGDVDVTLAELPQPQRQ